MICQSSSATENTEIFSHVEKLVLIIYLFIGMLIYKIYKQRTQNCSSKNQQILCLFKEELYMS